MSGKHVLWAVVAAIAVAPPAPAATITYSRGCNEHAGCGSSATFEAAAGEHNDVRVVADADGVTFHDATAPVENRAGPVCTTTGDGAITCGLTAVPTVFVRTGDGDDRAAVAAYGRSLDVVVDLGDGDDVFTGDGFVDGGAGDDRLTGSDHGNYLDGGPGRDIIAGRGGDDGISAGDADFDVVDGGAGRDTVGYFESTTGVTVDLAAGTGERDTLASIEDAEGSYHDDVIAGDAGANRLRALGGSDRLTGRAGDDLLVGAPGEKPTTADCGPGVDAVQADGGLAAVTDCERWRFKLQQRIGEAALHAGRGRVTLAVPCPLPPTGDGSPCHVRLNAARATVPRAGRRRLSVPVARRLTLTVSASGNRSVRAALELGPPDHANRGNRA